MLSKWLVFTMLRGTNNFKVVEVYSLLAGFKTCFFLNFMMILIICLVFYSEFLDLNMKKFLYNYSMKDCTCQGILIILCG